MATIAQNLQILKDSTDAIKQAIIDKGGTIEGDISTWANVISNIQSDSLLFDTYTYTPGLITNKLNGGIIGDPNIFYNLETVLYTYQLSPDVRDFIIFLNCQQEEGQYPNKNVRYFFTNITDYYYYKGIFPWITPESTFYARTTDQMGTISLSVDQFGDYSFHDSCFDHFIVLVFGEQCYDYDLFTLNISGCSCFTKDTLISLSNGITKKVQDIHYNDELLVWNFDEGKFDKAKPLWIKKTEQASYYYKVTLENGIILNLVGSNGKCHRLFNYDNQLFESATDLVGKQVSTLQGLSKVVSVEKIEETCEYYNIITDYHMN